MKRLSFYSLLAAVMLAGACQSNDSEQQTTGDPIKLHAVLENMGTTRTIGDVQNTQFSKGRQLSVYIFEDYEDSGKPKSTDYGTDGLVTFITADDQGNMQPTGSTYPYYPLNGNNVNIYALSPSGTVNAPNKESTSFTVLANQSDSANYKASDLLFTGRPGYNNYGGSSLAAENGIKNVAKSSNTVNLYFWHMLTRIQVELVQGTGNPTLTGAKVTLKDVYRTIDFTAPKTGYMTMGNNRSDKTDVVVTESYDTEKQASAVIVPQSLTTGVDFIHIQLGTDVLKFKLTQGITTMPGYSYKFRITVNHNSVEADYTVSDWNANPIPHSGGNTWGGTAGDTLVIKQ